MRLRTLFCCSVLLFAGAARPSTAVYLPPPLRIQLPFTAAWEGMLDVLESRKMDILKQERGRGLILTMFSEYISGSLTDSYLGKIGEKPKLLEGTWLKAEYQYQIEIELVTGTETLVTVYANIRGQKRDFFGNESWVDIATNGNREEELLTEFGRRLFGEEFSLERPRKGFWEREPSRIPDLEQKVPRVVAP